MSYRTNDKPPVRTLTVRKQGKRGSAAAVSAAAAILATGLVLACCAVVTARESMFGGIFVGAIALANLVVGAIVLRVTLAELRAHTRFTIDGHRLVIERADGTRTDVALHDVEGVTTTEQPRGSAVVYRTRIDVANGEPVLLEESELAGPDESTAIASIERFLREGRS